MLPVKTATVTCSFHNRVATTVRFKHAHRMVRTEVIPGHSSPTDSRVRPTMIHFPESQELAA